MPQQGQPVIVDYNHTVSTNNARISYVNFLVDPSAKAINVDTLITGSNDNIIIFEAVCVSAPVATNVISEITGNHDTLKVEVIEFPKEDKRALREVFKKYDIRGCFNLAKARGKTTLDLDYVMRRSIYPSCNLSEHSADFAAN